MARRSHRGRGQSTRRLSQWVGSADVTDHTSLAAATTLIDQSLTPADQPETIVRVRGLLTVESDQVAGKETPFGAIGFAIVSTEALAAGAASIPAPYSNAGDDGWFVHQFFSAPVFRADATGFGNIAQSYQFDSKAMRKLSPDDRVVMMVENASATDGLLFVLSFRMLLLAS